MSIPVITQPLTPRTIAQGVAIPTVILVATNTPTAWAASSLPAGIAINASTGAITGTPTTAGLVSTSITATNGTGSSAPVTIVWNIQGQPVGAGIWSDLELDFDLTERTVSIPGVERLAGAPVFTMARGDKVSLLVGARKFGVLRDVNPASQTVSLKVALKEFEPELVLTLAGGAATKLGSADTTRYRIPVWLDPAAWAVLGDYEGDASTMLIARAELELVVGPPLYARTVVVDDLTLSADLGGDDYGDPGPVEETLVFTGLTATAGASYTLQINLDVEGRVGQNVSLTQTMTITFAGGVWVISARTGPDIVSGILDPDLWGATLEVEAVTGDADSVDVDISISTTVNPEPGTIQFEIDPLITGALLPSDGVVFQNEARLRLFDADGDEIDAPGEVISSTYSSPATQLLAFADAWDLITGDPDSATVTVASTSTIRFVADDTTPVRSIRIENPTAPEIGSTVVGVLSPAPATITGTLSQLPSAADQPPRFTAQFPIGVMRDMVPDV